MGKNELRIVHFLISVGFFIGDSLWRLGQRILGSKPGSSCVVLTYHSVPDGQKEAFAAQMNTLLALTEPIPLDRVPPLLPGRRYSAITFDDGFENVINNAVPQLEKKGIPATVFLTVNYLGQTAGWWPASAPERLESIADPKRWRQLPGELISIGSHSLSHPFLTAVSETEAKRELCESRLVLEDLFKRRVTVFSFPYGEFSAELVRWCRDAGYERVFTSLPGNAFRNMDDFVCGRVNVRLTDWAWEFRLKILGAYRWLPFAISWKRRLKKHL